MSRTRRSGWRGALVSAILCVGVAASHATAAGGKGKGAKPAPPEPEEKLPPGCTRLATGYGAVASPDGRLVAFAREGAWLFPTVRHRPAELRVRDLKADTLTLLPHEARPAGWAGGTLLLDTGIGVDPVKGVRAPKVASLPTDATAAALAWTTDGKRLAWAPTAVKSAKTAVRVVGLEGKVATLAGTEGLRTDQAVYLAWSADGARLYVNGLFQDGAEVPSRRVGLVDAASGALTVLASMPDWISIPGLHDGYAPYRDPRVEDPKRVELDWGRPAEPRYGRQVLSGDGRLATWLAGTGWIEADAFVAEVSSGEVHRVTNDGEVKWSPALDPAGRRLAFLTADGAGGFKGYPNTRIRVVDLLTGEPTEIATVPEEGLAAGLSWRPDGGALIYDLRSLTKESTFAQTVPAPKPPPAGAKIRSLEFSTRNRVIAWLGSYDEDRVHTAVHRVEDAWDPYYLPALRETLKQWREKNSVVVHCLVHLLDLRGVREAIPDLREALATKAEANRVSILTALLHLGERDVLEELEHMRTASKDEDTRFRIGVQMVKAGDDRGWPSLAEAANSKDLFLRRDLCRELAKIKQPRSVAILIPLVADRRLDPTFKFIKITPVAPLAQLALRALTGKSLGDDPAKWTAWWKDEAKETLPADVPPPADPEHELGG